MSVFRVSNTDWRRSRPSSINAVPNNKHNESGFSAIELLITLIVLGVAFGAFANTFNTIQNINKRAFDINDANSAAYAKVQEYENLPFDDLPDTLPYGTLEEVEDFSSTLPDTLPKPRTATVYINTVSPTLKQIVVKVSYGPGDQQTAQYADFMQRNGL